MQAQRIRASRGLSLVALAMGVALMTASPSRATETGAGGTRGAGEPGNALPGPSLSGTGKVGAAKLEGEPPAKSMRPAPKVARPEPPVAAPSHGASAAAPSPPAKVPVPAATEAEITARLPTLNECRIDVARDKHRPPKEIRVGALLLRWRIGVDGTVSGAEVVAKTPVDPAVMECARQAITKWRFTAPDQGPLAIERRYRFPP
jgi:hypothetical protein